MRKKTLEIRYTEEIDMYSRRLKGINKELENAESNLELLKKGLDAEENSSPVEYYLEVLKAYCFLNYNMTSK